MDEASVDLFQKILGAYSIFLIVYGSLGNSLAIAVCLRKDLRRIPTFLFTAFALAADILTLFWWNIDHYTYGYENYQMEFLSIFLCRFVTFFQTTSLHISAWLLVCMTVERYLSVRIKSWRSVYFKPKTAVLISICIVLVIITYNASLVSQIEYDELDPNVSCFTSDYNLITMQVHIVSYGFLPYAIMMISNILLVRTVLKGDSGSTVERSDESNAKRKSLSISVMILTTAFIILSLPNNVANAFLLNFLLEHNWGFAVLFLTDNMVFSYHASTFLILYLTNKRFSKECRDCWTMIVNRGKVDDRLFTRTRMGNTTHTA